MAWTSLSGGQKAAALAGGGVMLVAVGLTAAWLSRAPQPGESRPVVAAAPAVSAPVPDQPMADQPVADQPVPDQPVPDQPVPDQPVPDQPVPDQPVAEKPATDEAVVVAPGAAPVAVADPAVADAGGAVPVPAAPGFDLVRVDPDGAVLVAGRAEPGAQVGVLVDAAEVARTQADGGGKFVAQFTLPPSDAPRLMALVMQMPDGQAIPGVDTVAIAPFSAPAVVAMDAPAAQADAGSAAPVAEAAPDPTPPAALLVTQSGVSVLQPATPPPAGPAATVSIDTIAYAPDGAVMLGGRGAPLQFLRLYLDNAEVATLAVPDSGQWTRTLTEIAPGIYALRVDQLDADGKVTARFETPFKRETLEALASAAAPPLTPAAPVAVAKPAVVAAAEPPASIAPDILQPQAVQSDPAGSEPAPTPVAEAPPVAAPPITSAPIVEAPVAVAEPQVQPAPAPAAPAPPFVATAEPAPLAPAPPTAEPAPVAEAAPAVPPPPVSVTVQPGFTLWAIARENFGDGVMYVEVYEANKDKIRDPDLIYPGQVFTIPQPPPPPSP